MMCRKTSAPFARRVARVGDVQVGARDLDVDARVLLRLKFGVQHAQSLAPVVRVQAGLFACGGVLQVPRPAAPEDAITVHADPLVERIEPIDLCLRKTASVWQSRSGGLVAVCAFY
jgi:hypothetical protein